MENPSLKGMALALPIMAVLSVGAIAVSVHAATQPAPATGSPAAAAPAPGTAAPTTAAAPVTTPPAPDMSKLSDADILGLNLAIDSNEIDAAMGAEKKKMGKDAMAYAKMLRKEHAKDADKALKLGKSIGMHAALPAVAVDLRAKGAAEWSGLKAMEGEAFERAYVAAMVNGHTEALQLIDSRMIPNAGNADLKKHLAELRTHVSAHLEHGKRLQGARAANQAD